MHMYIIHLMYMYTKCRSVGRSVGLTVGRSDERMGGRTDERADGRMDWRMDGRAGGQAVGWMEDCSSTPMRCQELSIANILTI